MRRGSLVRERRVPLDVPACPAAWLELQAFLSAFQVRFQRPEGREVL
jgi:hypothetical protein